VQQQLVASSSIAAAFGGGRSNLHSLDVLAVLGALGSANDWRPAVVYAADFAEGKVPAQD